MNLFLFTTDVLLAREAEAAGIDGVIVDCETRGKASRQSNYATDLASATPQDVANLVGSLTLAVTVRLNSLGNHTRDEIELALDLGAKSLLLPMARDAGEVDSFVRMVGGRAEAGIMIETQELVERCSTLRESDWQYGYIGLNDLMISRRAAWLWEPLMDGTVEKIFTVLSGRALGFGGITIVGEGHPIRFSSLLREMSRLGSKFGVLRRSFIRDIVGRNIDAEIRAIRAHLYAAELRNTERVASDHVAFLDELKRVRNQVLSA